MADRLRKARRVLQDAETARATVPPRSVPSLARDALVLALNPRTGKIWNDASFTVPTALLVELTHEGRLSVSGTGKKVRATVRDPAPLGDPELDDALTVVGSGMFGQKVTRLVDVVPSTPQLLRRLVADGVLTVESRRLLGVIPVRRYRPTPAADRDRLVASLRSALMGESIPDERTALLIAVLVDVHWKLFVPRHAVNDAFRRAPELLDRIGPQERAIVEAARVALSNSD